MKPSVRSTANGYSTVRTKRFISRTAADDHLCIMVELLDILRKERVNEEKINLSRFSVFSLNYRTTLAILSGHRGHQLVALARGREDLLLLLLFHVLSE